MIRRLLFLALAVAAVVWWLRKRISAMRAPAHVAGASRERPAQAEGRMVRDRVCNTFLPESRALSTQLQGQEHFFCSEKCRDEFLSREGVHPA